MEEQLLLLGDGTKIDATTSTRLFHAAQQIVCNWAHFSGEDRRSAIYDVIDQTLEELDVNNVENSKLIIWTYYKLTTRNVMAYLLDQGYNAVAAYGEVNSNKSFELFMEDPTVRILVAQPQSAGVGLNAQGVCSEMLFVETPTTPLLARQAIGRVVRMGQKRKPRIKVAVAQNTIQVRLLDQLMSNDDLVKRVENTQDSIRSWLKGR
jgi:SNF2 family DNA or RNA helicase